MSAFEFVDQLRLADDAAQLPGDGAGAGLEGGVGEDLVGLDGVGGGREQGEGEEEAAGKGAFGPLLAFGQFTPEDTWGPKMGRGRGRHRGHSAGTRRGGRGGRGRRRGSGGR